MNLPVAILAGGRATRLGAVAEHVPKSLVDIGGRPFATHQLELLRSQGFTDIVFLIGHFGEAVRDAIGDGSSLGVHVRYVFDGPTPQGTGGAVLGALSELGDAFLVIYGDSYLECDYGEVVSAFLGGNKAGLMTVYENDGRWDRSNVLYRHGQILKYDKTRADPDMRHIDYGLGAFRRRAFAGRTSGEAFDLSTIYQDLLTADDLAGFEVTTRFYEIGSLGGLEDTRAHLARKDGPA